MKKLKNNKIKGLCSMKFEIEQQKEGYNSVYFVSARKYIGFQTDADDKE